jgi:hypothetical protein
MAVDMSALFRNNRWIAKINSGSKGSDSDPLLPTECDTLSDKYQQSIDFDATVCHHLDGLAQLTSLSKGTDPPRAKAGGEKVIGMGRLSVERLDFACLGLCSRVSFTSFLRPFAGFAFLVETTVSQQ